MASLVVEIEEEQKHEDVDALFALGINVRCVDLSWTYDKVLLTFPKAAASLNSNPSLAHLPISRSPLLDINHILRIPYFGQVATKSLICV